MVSGAARSPSRPCLWKSRRRAPRVALRWWVQRARGAAGGERRARCRRRERRSSGEAVSVELRVGDGGGRRAGEEERRRRRGDRVEEARAAAQAEREEGEIGEG